MLLPFTNESPLARKKKNSLFCNKCTPLLVYPLTYLFPSDKVNRKFNRNILVCFSLCSPNRNNAVDGKWSRIQAAGRPFRGVFVCSWLRSFPPALPAFNFCLFCFKFVRLVKGGPITHWLRVWGAPAYCRRLFALLLLLPNFDTF